MQQLEHIQPLDLPEIFQPAAGNLPSMDLVAVENNTRWTEFVAQLSQFGELDVPETREHLELLLAGEGAPEKRAALLTGIARCEIGEGHLLDAAQLLGYAYTLTGETHRDIRAFVLLEMVALLAIIGNYDTALMLLGTISTLTKSDYLQHLARYYSLVNGGRKGDISVIEALKASADYFRKIDQTATLAYHYKNIGNIFGKLGDYASTRNYYEQALTLTENPQYRHIKAAVLHDMGMLHYRQGDFDQAVTCLQESADLAQSYYTKSYAIGNIGFIHFQKKEFIEATPYFERSLDLAAGNGVFHLVPGNCYYLGQCFEQQGKASLAGHYYERGSELALELAQRKFPLKGERFRIINAYIDFLKRNQSVPAQSYTRYDFSFALGKTLREIRAVFQNSVLDVMVHKSGSVQQAIRRLDMARRTYSKTLERIRPFVSEDAPEPILQFIHENDTLTWRELNRKFDDHLLGCLYHHYGMNKKKLSAELGVNYSRLVSRFKEIAPEALACGDANSDLTTKEQP